jgi:hypothetical protein
VVELDDEGKILKGGYYFGKVELPVEGGRDYREREN